jgi:ribulose 1,5-bisphosphate synthetase/thiazole synthase
METKQYDVIVCGGGPGGIAAALGAARLGMNTLLIERYGFLGGGATAMLVNPFMRYTAGKKQIIYGVLQDMIKALRAMDAYGAPRQANAFDTEAFKLVAEQLCLQAGVQLLYHALVSDVTVDAGGNITELEVATKGCKLRLSARQFVDATGDADVATLAGAMIEKGRSADGLMQPMTLNFRVGGIDTARMPSREEISQLFVAAKERGDVECPRENVLWFYTNQPGVIHFNTTRVVKKDPTDPWQMTEAEVEGRRQAWQVWSFLRKEVPGFEESYLQMTAPQIGVRESRRVIGEYVMTADDCLTARKFADVVTRGSYSVDIHNPEGTGTVIKRVPEGDWYEIPYRCLVPLKLENLLIGSRSISTTHEAHSAIRVIPIVMGIGQAAGIAAALCVKQGCTPRTLPVALLQKELVAQGQRFDKPGLDLPEANPS